MLRSIRAKGIGSFEPFLLDFGQRLNFLTGDNGLGKTFLLDLCWWTLTGRSTDMPADPPENSVEAEIYVSVGNRQMELAAGTAKFEHKEYKWNIGRSHPAPDAVVVYARVDGSFSIWDSVRNNIFVSSFEGEQSFLVQWLLDKEKPLAKGFHFDQKQVWDGLPTEKNDQEQYCNGLINDWIIWQKSPAEPEFRMLREALSLFCHPAEIFEIAEPRRFGISGRIVPFVKFDYGEVPLLRVSASFKRIISLTYLIVWAWTEHKYAAKTMGKGTSKELIVIVDELESHLHPKWQRSILRSLLHLSKALEQEIDLQIICSTHSPLVLASAEPYFDKQQDKLFLFDLVDKKAIVAEEPWTPHGDTIGWLTSNIFGLRDTRSEEAEKNIKIALDLMDSKECDVSAISETHANLVSLLPDNDPFWLRWQAFRQKCTKK